MRFRTILLILAIVLVAGFVTLNVDEFTRSSVLSLGFTTVKVSLGLVMLLLLAITLVVFLASTLYLQNRHALEAQTHGRALNAQRELADKAEASRFSELRAYLAAQAAAEQQREAAADTVLAERFAQQQRALLSRLDQLEISMATFKSQVQDRPERDSVLARSTALASDGSKPPLS